jgi:hypothetical protein
MKMTVNEWGRLWMEAVVAYSRIWLDEMRKNPRQILYHLLNAMMKIAAQPPLYAAGLPTTLTAKDGVFYHQTQVRDRPGIVHLR